MVRGWAEGSTSCLASPPSCTPSNKSPVSAGPVSGKCWKVKTPTHRPMFWHPLLRWKPMKRYANVNENKFVAAKQWLVPLGQDCYVPWMGTTASAGSWCCPGSMSNHKNFMDILEVIGLATENILVVKVLMSGMDKVAITSKLGTEKILMVIGPAISVMFLGFSQVTWIKEVGSASTNNLEVIIVVHRAKWWWRWTGSAPTIEVASRSAEVNQPNHAQITGTEQQECLCWGHWLVGRNLIRPLIGDLSTRASAWGDQTMQGTMRAYQTWLALERLRLTAPQPNLEHLGHPHCGLPQSCKRCFDATALVDGKSACSHLEYPKTCMVVFHSVVVCLENLEELWVADLDHHCGWSSPSPPSTVQGTAPHWSSLASHQDGFPSGKMPPWTQPDYACGEPLGRWCPMPWLGVSYLATMHQLPQLEVFSTFATLRGQPLSPSLQWYLQARGEAENITWFIMHICSQPIAKRWSWAVLALFWTRSSETRLPSSQWTVSR